MLEGFAHHDGTEVGASDTNVDDGVNGFTGVSLPRAGSDLFGELFDVSEDLVDLVTGSGLVNLPTALAGRWVSQSNVEHSSVFRRVDVLSGKHVVSELLDVGLPCEGKQGREDLIVDQVFRVVQEDRRVGSRRRLELKREFLESRRVGLE